MHQESFSNSSDNVKFYFIRFWPNYQRSIRYETTSTDGIIVITMRIMMQVPSCAVISNIAHRNETQIARASKTECAAAAVTSSRLWFARAQKCPPRVKFLAAQNADYKIIVLMLKSPNYIHHLGHVALHRSVHLSASFLSRLTPILSLSLFFLHQT